MPTRKIVADVVIVDNSKVFLVKSSYRSDWQFPGGHVEANETPRAAAQRESDEEIGKGVVRVGALLALNVEADGTLCFLFSGVLTGQAIQVDGQEIIDHAWVEMAAVPDRLVPVLAQAWPVIAQAIETQKFCYGENGLVVE